MESLTFLKSFQWYKRRFIKNYGRERWKVECRLQLEQYFDSWDDEDDVIARLLECIKDLVLEMEGDKLRRDDITDFMRIFTFLVKCAQLWGLKFRWRSQRLLSRLLEFFDGTAQYLVICRLFDLVLAHEIMVEKEPEILAWFIDMYRRRMGHDEAEFRSVFINNLSHFYGLIIPVAYEDVWVAHHFYVSVMLLVSYHALIGEQIQLLPTVKVKLVDAYQTQVAEFFQVQRKFPWMSFDERCERPYYGLELMKFTMSDARKKVDNALQKT